MVEVRERLTLELQDLTRRLTLADEVDAIVLTLRTGVSTSLASVQLTSDSSMDLGLQSSPDERLLGELGTRLHGAVPRSVNGGISILRQPEAIATAPASRLTCTADEMFARSSRLTLQELVDVAVMTMRTDCRTRVSRRICIDTNGSREECLLVLQAAFRDVDEIHAFLAEINGRSSSLSVIWRGLSVIGFEDFVRFGVTISSPASTGQGHSPGRR